MPAIPADIITFWRNAGPSKWFVKDIRFDAVIRLKFEPVHYAAARGTYDAWRLTPDGALALLLLLDQFPRNLYRGTAHAFATDPLALSIAKGAVDAGFDLKTDPALRAFFYLPFEHSEDMDDQERSLALFQALGEKQGLDYAIVHRDVIARFGRFPHRNACLGRETTALEQAFLDDGGFAG